MLSTQLRHRTLRRLRQGVYLAESAWPEHPREQHLMLAFAEVAANPAGVLSHQSAALSWRLPEPGFDSWASQPPSVTLPAGFGFRPNQGATLHHIAHLPPAQVTKNEAGYPITNLARTAIDLAAGLKVPQALVILDAAAQKLCAGFVPVPRREHYASLQLIHAASSARLRSPVGARDCCQSSLWLIRVGNRPLSRSLRVTFTWPTCPPLSSRHPYGHPSALSFPIVFGQSTGSSVNATAP